MRLRERRGLQVRLRRPVGEDLPRTRRRLVVPAGESTPSTSVLPISAPAQTEAEPAAAELVEQRGPFGHLHRMQQRRQRDRGADADPFGAAEQESGGGERALG